MSYEIVRKILQNRVIDTNSSFGLTLAEDGKPADVGHGKGFISILHGDGRRISTGAPGANQHRYPGVLALTFFTDPESGSSAASTTVDSIINAFTGLKVDENNVPASLSSAVVIDFEVTGLVPHLQDQQKEGANLRTVVACPFVWTVRK